jgi:hypothetical protein
MSEQLGTLTIGFAWVFPARGTFVGRLADQIVAELFKQRTHRLATGPRSVREIFDVQRLPAIQECPLDVEMVPG